MKKKVITILIAICITVVYMPSIAFAEGLNADSDVLSDVSENSEIIENSEDLENSEVLSKEDYNEETGKTIQQIIDLSESGIDYSSQRLIVKGLKQELKDEPVIAHLDDVYLLQYDSVDEVINAYFKLSKISDSVEFDSSMVTASQSVGIGVVGGEDIEPMTKEENPFKEVDEIKTETSKYNVAVIDTGSNNADKIISVLGDDGKDKNGHGQKMIDTIKTYAPDAKVLSIKAIDDNGIGTVSAVYAALRLAIDEKVDVINLSISALATEDNFIIEEIIEEAQSKGITVVGAAGNNNIDAKRTIPGKIKDAIIVGTTNKASNTGDTVDYYVPVDSTSLATALVTGLIISDTLKDYEVVDKVIKIKVDEDNDSGNSSDPSDEFTTQGDGGGGGSSGGALHGGGSKVAETQPIVYVWFDKGGFTADGRRPAQGAYSKSAGWINNNSGTNPIDYQISLITKKIRAKGGRYKNDKYNPNLKGAHNRVSEFKAAAKEACINAIDRSGDNSQRARIVCVAVTLLHDDDTNSWWFGGHAAGGNWAYYHNMIPRAGKSSELQPWGPNSGWNEIVDHSKWNNAQSGERWYNYIYRIGYKDVGDVNLKNGKRYIVLAVTDNQPSNTVDVKIKKTWTNNAVVSGNSLYSLNGIVFKLYKSASDAKNNTGAVATWTTDANGNTTKQTVTPGNYYLVEMGPPKLGVVIPDVLKASNGGKAVNIAENTTINITDTPPSGTYTASYRYTFDGGTLPAEVMATLPATTTHQNETVVTAATPSETEITVGDYVYMFDGWDAPAKGIHSANISFTGSWSIEDADMIDDEGEAYTAAFEYTLVDENNLPIEDEDIPEEVLATLPVDMNEDGDYNIYLEGDTMLPLDPTEPMITVETDEGSITYSFISWSPTSHTVVDSGITFVGTWMKILNVPQ